MTEHDVDVLSKMLTHKYADAVSSAYREFYRIFDSNIRSPVYAPGVKHGGRNKALFTTKDKVFYEPIFTGSTRNKRITGISPRTASDLKLILGSDYNSMISALNSAKQKLIDAIGDDNKEKLRILRENHADEGLIHELETKLPFLDTDSRQRHYKWTTDTRELDYLHRMFDNRNFIRDTAADKIRDEVNPYEKLRSKYFDNVVTEPEDKPEDRPPIEPAKEEEVKQDEQKEDAEPAQEPKKEEVVVDPFKTFVDNLFDSYRTSRDEKYKAYANAFMDQVRNLDKAGQSDAAYRTYLGKYQDPVKFIDVFQDKVMQGGDKGLEYGSLIADYLDDPSYVAKDDEDKARYDYVMQHWRSHERYPDVANPYTKAANPDDVPIRVDTRKEPAIKGQPMPYPQPQQSAKVNQSDISAHQPVLIPQYAQPTNVHNLVSYDYALTTNAEYMRKQIQNANNKLFPRYGPEYLKKMRKLRIDMNKNYALKGGMPLSAFL